MSMFNRLLRHLEILFPPSAESQHRIDALADGAIMPVHQILGSTLNYDQAGWETIACGVTVTRYLLRSAPQGYVMLILAATMSHDDPVAHTLCYALTAPSGGGGTDIALQQSAAALAPAVGFPLNNSLLVPPGWGFTVWANAMAAGRQMTSTYAYLLVPVNSTVTKAW